MEDMAPVEHEASLERAGEAAARNPTLAQSHIRRKLIGDIDPIINRSPDKYRWSLSLIGKYLAHFNMDREFVEKDMRLKIVLQEQDLINIHFQLFYTQEEKIELCDEDRALLSRDSRICT